MTRILITPDQHAAALQSLGLTADTCPVCERFDALTVTVNGDGGIHTVCAGDGCQEQHILRVYQREVRRHEAGADELDPLKKVNEILTRGREDKHVLLVGHGPAPQVAGVDRHGTNGALFVIHFADYPSAEVQGARGIYDRNRFRDAIGEQLGVTIDLPPKEHRNLAALLVGIAVPRDDLDTGSSELHDWIDRFLPRCQRVDLENRAQAADFIKEKRSFITTQGELYLRPDEFVTYVCRQLDGRTTRDDIQRRLARLGFTARQPTAGRDRNGKQIKNRYWVASLALLDERETTGGDPTGPSIGNVLPPTSRGIGGIAGSPSNDGAIPSVADGITAGTNGNTPGGEAL